MTNSDLITQCLRLLGVLSEVETASAEQGTQGLSVLNDLMANWEEEGINLGYYPQISLTDDLPIPSHARLCVRYYLALALAPEYGKSVSTEFGLIAQNAYDRMIRDVVVLARSESKLDHLPIGEGQWR